MSDKLVRRDIQVKSDEVRITYIIKDMNNTISHTTNQHLSIE